MRTTKAQLSALIKEVIQTRLHAFNEAKFDPALLNNIGNPTSSQGLTDFKQKVHFAEDQGLELVGQGVGRAVFLLDSKRVLKIAKDKSGVGQNMAEAKMSQDPDSVAILARVFRHHPQYHWVVSELVRSVRNVEEFEKLSGTDWPWFMRLLNAGIGGPSPENFASTAQKQRAALATKNADTTLFDKTASSPFLKSVQSLIAKFNLLHGDLRKIEHWGKTADQRLVLLDYGYTVEVEDNFY